MSQPTSSRLRRAPGEAVASTPRVAAGKKTAPIHWRGLPLTELGEALVQPHHEKILWKKLVETISKTLSDEAIALVSMEDGRVQILAADGLHEQLRVGIAAQDALCAFLGRPEAHIPRLSEQFAGGPEAAAMYEFIEHYWGWRLASEGAPRVFLMMFGADASAPSPLAESAAYLASYVCWHISTERRRKQLVSDLAAEAQGLRIDAAEALRRRLDSWMARDDGGA